MVNRYKDWVKQAKLDLDHAKRSLELSHYEWVCLASQQAAEKALKGLYYFLNFEVWGHGISRLLKEIELPINPPNDIIDKAKVLDRHYIPSRYPNGLIYGTPRENYSENDAKEAITIAEEILEFCENQISTIKKRNQKMD